MKVYLGASLVAMFCLCAGSALAGSAVLNSDMTAFEGPGDNYRPVLHLVAGQRIDILECDVKQWCRVEHDGTLGWVHAILKAPQKPGGGGGTSGTPGSNSSDTASGGGNTGGGGGGSGKMPKFSKVGGEITQTGDGGGSSGGSGGGTTGRQRASASGGGGSGTSSPPASVATESAPPPEDTGKLATTPSCFRC